MTDPDALPWPLPGRTDLRDALVTAYSTGRGYHDLRHLQEVLARIDELGAGENTPVVLAAWFHDAVYEDGHEHDQESNEKRSAVLAEESLEQEDVDVAEVARLVRLTETHDPGSSDRNGEILCDADLAILAAAPDRYEEYAAGVRREYAAFSDADFVAGRLAVLRDLAGRPALFRTEHARREWEPVARENLAKEIARLHQTELSEAASGDADPRR